MKKEILIVLFFSMPAIVCAASMDWITVGDPGNTADTSGYGSVNYEYRISSKEVTNAQYCEFLNAVAVNDDPYTLWDNSMQIYRSSGPPFTYTVYDGKGDHPVQWVIWPDAIRFVNWMHNGQISGDPNESTTEDGAYPAPDYDSFRKPNAKYWLPTENEWYKAAFYKGGGTNAGYYLYATSSDTPPTDEPPPGDTNSANYNQTAGPSSYTTVAGGYWQSVSCYGTFDQCGNVGEWTEASGAASDKPVWGGDCYNTSAPDSGDSSTVSYITPADYIGFRIAAHRDTIVPLVVCLEYPRADLDGDCIVSLPDFAIMASEWLLCNLDPPENCPP